MAPGPLAAAGPGASRRQHLPRKKDRPGSEPGPAGRGVTDRQAEA
jgi:hypothetical protein